MTETEHTSEVAALRRRISNQRRELSIANGRLRALERIERDLDQEIATLRSQVENLREALEEINAGGKGAMMWDYEGNLVEVRAFAWGKLKALAATEPQGEGGE